MTDLTKNKKALGLLKLEDIHRIEAAPKEEVLFFDGMNWGPCKQRYLSLHFTYRLKPQELTKPSPPWELLSDWVKYVARDKGGVLWGFDSEPYVEGSIWVLDFSEEAEASDLMPLKIDPGTCDWRDSLVKRPDL